MILAEDAANIMGLIKSQIKKCFANLIKQQKLCRILKKKTKRNEKYGLLQNLMQCNTEGQKTRVKKLVGFVWSYCVFLVSKSGQRKSNFTNDNLQEGKEEEEKDQINRLSTSLEENMMIPLNCLNLLFQGFYVALR